MLQYWHCLAVVAETSRNDIFDSFWLQFLAFPFSVWNGIPFLSILFAAFPCQQTSIILALYSTVTPFCVEMMVSYIHGRKGEGVPKGRPMMDRARREHKNDININVTGHSCKRHHGLSTNLRYNRNIEYRFFNILLRIWNVMSLYLGSAVKKGNWSLLWFSSVFADKCWISDWLPNTPMQGPSGEHAYKRTKYMKEALVLKEHFNLWMAQMRNWSSSVHLRCPVFVVVA